MPKRKCIYTVTVMKIKDNETVINRNHCWGWFSNKKDAIESVLENRSDLFECNYYNYAVVEKYCEGVPALSEKEFWFVADYPDVESENVFHPKISRTRKPLFLRNIVNFAF
jgi:hypothetical protein